MGMMLPRHNIRKLEGSMIALIILFSSFAAPLLLISQYAEAAPDNWWNIDWKFRKTLIIDHTRVTGVLENFPVIVDILDSDVAAKAQVDGDDIVFTDDKGIQLNHEIESYNSSLGHLIAWVNVPLLSSVTDTILYIYYGNTNVENQQNPLGVWDSNYVMVQHLEEDNTNTRYDSSSNHNDGTAYNGIEKSTLGMVDGADLFDGVNDYIQILNTPSLNPSSAISIELWMNLSSTGDFINLVSKGAYSQFYLRLGPQQGRTYWFVKFSDGNSSNTEGSAGWTYENWHHLVATSDTTSQTIKVYVDGVTKLVRTFDPGKSLIATSNLLLISLGSQRRIKGMIDEVRISNISRSINWISTSYNNQKSPSTFYTMGNEESLSGAPFVSNEEPRNGATGVYTNPELSVQVVDPQGDYMTILFSTNASGIWQLIGNYSNVGNGEYSVIPSNMDNLGTLYHWNVSVGDGENWTNKTYSFTTTTSILEQKWIASGLPRTRHGVLIADLTGDSSEEVVYGGTGSITVLSGIDGSKVWTFSDSRITDWTKPQMADLNKDGILEIVVPLQNGGLIALHGNNGTIYWVRTNLGQETMSSPVIADIDGDGYPTIFFASTDIYHGLNGTGKLTSLSHDGNILHQVFTWRPCGGGLSIADTDGDGEFEVYMGDRSMYYTDSNYGRGVRSFWARNLTERWNHPDVLCSSHIPMLAYVDKDGIMDVIVGDLNGGVLVLNSTDGSAIKKSMNLGDNAPVHYQPSVHDVDRDGNLELLMANFEHPDLVVWDLVDWKVDAKIPLGESMFGPQLGDLTGDGIMEIIATSYTTMFILDSTYSQIAKLTPPVGVLNYAVVQDIDADGYNELVISATTGYVYAYDTPARRPNPRPRSEVQFYSEYRLGAAEYIQPPGSPEPIISVPSPQNNAENVIISLSELSFTLTDYQHDLMNYSITTYPNIGSATEQNVGNSRYALEVSDLQYATTYTWMVTVTDGVHQTNTTYTFTTQPLSAWWNYTWQHRKA